MQLHFYSSLSLGYIFGSAILQYSLTNNHNQQLAYWVILNIIVHCIYFLQAMSLFKVSCKTSLHFAQFHDSE